MLTADRKLQGAEFVASLQQLVVMKEEPPEQQEWSSSLQQEDSEPPHIKEEEEELWSSQEGEQLQGLEEADSTKFTFTPVPVKSEDEEEKPQSSQLHHRQSQQMETGADGEDQPGPGPHPDPDSGPEIEVKMEDFSETEDSEDWEDQSGLDSVDERKNSEQRSDSKETPREKEKPLSCSFCGRVFINKGNLTRHMAVHTIEKPYSCSECGKGFTQKSNLSLHLAQHRGKPYSCSDCQETFSNFSLLLTHSRTHRGLKRFVCPVCSREWRSFSKLRNHLRVHTGEKPYGCTDCGRRYSSLFQVRSHRCVGTSEPLTKTGFQSQNDAESDPEEDSDPDPGEETNPSVQPEDGAEGELWKKSRKRRSAVTYRRKQKVSGDEGCGPESKTKQGLKTHQADKMDLNSQSRSLTDLDLLLDEELCETGAEIHQDPSEGSHLETGSGLERLLTEFTAENQNFCESSEDPQTETKGPLTAKRLLSCPQCGAGFVKEQDLLVHMRIHIKEHLFSCSVCGQRFADRDSLTSHVSSHAVGEPFCCSVCDPGFPQSQSECEHMKGGAEQTRFHCFCGEEFTWRRHLIRHMEDHRPEHAKLRLHGCSEGPDPHQTTNQDSAAPGTTDREETWMDSRGLQSLRGSEQDLPESRVIKEEQEEVWISQADVIKFTFSPVSVKREEEERPQSSQLHHREDCGGPGLQDSVSGPTRVWEDEASERLETKSDDSVDSDFWKEGDAQRKSSSLSKEDVPKSVRGNKIYICFRCGERFHVLGDLRGHERRVHRIKEKKKKTFPCSVCGHVCPYLSHLKIHMRRHTGEKPFICQKCGKKYAQKENLRLHMLKHARESPWDTEPS